MKKIILKNMLITPLVFALTLTAGVVAASEQDSTSETTLTWTGCGISKAAFMEDLADGYYAEKGVRIQMSSGGATKGIRKVNQRSSDLGGSCRYKIPGTGLERKAKMTPVGWGALVAITHPSNPVKSITIAQLKKIYDGGITDWSQLKGKKGPINVMARVGKISGVGRTMRELVYGDASHDYGAKVKSQKSSGPLEKAVAKDKNAIGITGVSSAKRRGGLKILHLDGVEPSYENIASGNYKLYRPLYLVTNIEDQRPEVLEFIEFAHSETGREIIKNAGTVPYLDALPLVMRSIDEYELASEKGSL